MISSPEIIIYFDLSMISSRFTVWLLSSNRPSFRDRERRILVCFEVRSGTIWPSLNLPYFIYCLE